MPASYTIAEHIVNRLAALGAAHVFAVPGNYTAQFLQVAYASGKLAYIGTTNEMEAGYAADAYARLRGIGVACVTYGVGSLSLLNAIAGAYVERCPVVLINGTANADKVRQLVSQGVLFAHAIDTVRTDAAAFRSYTAATVVVDRPQDAARRIDEALRACITHKLPVYIEVHDDVWLDPCEQPENPDAPLTPFVPDTATDADIAVATLAAVEDVVRRLRAATKPVLWGGEELQRYGLQDEFERLIEVSGLPYTTTLLGKSLVSENKDTFVGVYDSVFAPARTKAAVEEADCILALGTILSDFYGKIVADQYDRMVLAAAGAVRVGRSVYTTVPLDRFVRALLERWESEKVAAPFDHERPAAFAAAQRLARLEAEQADTAFAAATDTKITWEAFFACLQRLLTDDMVVLADTSLVLFPAADLVIKRRSHFVAQTAWLSIGYTVGASVGISAALGSEGRAVALVGDGGFQTVPQAFATLARLDTRAIVIVFDNGLYGIEQFLVDRTYYETETPAVFFNELARWDYAKLGEALGGRGRVVATTCGLEAALREARDAADSATLIAVPLDPRKLPRELTGILPSASLSAAADHAAVATGFAAAGFN